MIFHGDFFLRCFNTGSLQKKNLTELKGEIDKFSFIWKLQYPYLLSLTDRTRPRISKDIEEFNNTINQKDRIDIYRTILPMTKECLLLSSIHGIFTKIEHNQGHKTTHINIKQLN